MRDALRTGAMIAAALLAMPVPLAVAQSSDPDPTNPPANLRYLGSYEIYNKESGLTEPSGLVADPAADGFWTVSDDTHHILRLDGKGTVIEISPKINALADAEGITLDASGQEFFVLSEKNAEIFAIAREDLQVVKRFPLRKMRGADKVAEALEEDLEALSPEGITVDTETGELLIVNERAPRLLIRIAPSLDEILSVELLLDTDGFVVQDLSDARLDASGLAYDPVRDGLWITSDTGQCLFYRGGPDGPALRFALLWQDGKKVRPVENAEGIALDSSGRRLFVVSDNRKQSRLYVYGVE